MIIAVAGVKGGAGKTLVATSLALSNSQCRFLDCDVEEPDGHLYLRPSYRKLENVKIATPAPRNWLRGDLRPAADFCPTNALAVIKGRLIVFKELCIGCGGCFLVAPPGALAKEDMGVGSVKTGSGRNGIEVVTGELKVGSQRTEHVVAAVKRKVVNDRDNVIDCPPGSARPMLEAVRGSDYCLLVTEATPFGLEDLNAGIEALRLMGVRFGVIVNKVRKTDAGVADICGAQDVPIVMEIPFSRDVAEASSRGRVFQDMSPRWIGELSRLWERIRRI